MPTLRSGQSVANLTFCNVSFNFATIISKFDTFSSYHIVRTRIAKVTASFSLFALSELVCTKKYLTLYIIPYLFTPSLFAFRALGTDWLTDWRTDKVLHPLFPKFFFSTERAGPYSQVQLYWAGRTVGWMADWTSLKPLLGPVSNTTTFGTTGFVVTESDLVGLFESYKARILPLYVQTASICSSNLD